MIYHLMYDFSSTVFDTGPLVTLKCYFSPLSFQFFSLNGLCSGRVLPVITLLCASRLK